MLDDWIKYPCPCCGHKVFDYSPGHHQRCPICAWEDDLAQLRFADMVGGANHVSLMRAQQNYQERGVAALRQQGETRRPVDGEEVEEGWRPIDVAIDNIEQPQRGLQYADSYPYEDTTVLYYWRSTYWRRMDS
jgi:hypothetical protein